MNSLVHGTALVGGFVQVPSKSTPLKPSEQPHSHSLLLVTMIFLMMGVTGRRRTEQHTGFSTKGQKQLGILPRRTHLGKRSEIPTAAHSLRPHRGTGPSRLNAHGLGDVCATHSAMCSANAIENRIECMVSLDLLMCCLNNEINH